MKKIIYTAFLIILLAFAASAQNCDTVENCNRKLGEASQMINKLLDVSRSKDAVIETQKAEIEAHTRLNAVNEEILRAKEAVVAEQKKLIEILEKQSRRKISVFFRLIKIHF